MEYMSVKEAAEKWGTTARSAQKYCTEGRVEGAVKFSGAWAIPVDAQKPTDMRKPVEKKPAKPKRAVTEKPKSKPKQNLRTVMPLMNTPYRVGSCLQTVMAIKDEDTRNIALGEYYYFSGQSAKASDVVEEYLTHSDLALRLSACLLYAYSNLALDRIQRTKQAMAQIRQTTENVDDDTPLQYKAYAACISTAAGTLLHLPMPKESVPIKQILGMMPTGIRLFALYLEAHEAYLNKRYGSCIAISETALALEEKLYPITSIYLHLVAAMGYINIRQTKEASNHVLEAWSIARPDDMIEAFGEHHGLLGGMLEVVMKTDYPEDFKRIINITYSFSAGWRKIHNPNTGHQVADDLTTTEFTVAMLAARGWGNKEIASHLHVSANTVRTQLNTILQKLGNPSRAELSKFMLK